jgi:GR25 family glycosyltransferase involved in LPS biosynthesis
MKKIAIGITIFIFGFIVYMFLFGKLFAFSPVILGFNKHELKNTICYTQRGSEYIDFELIDTLISLVEEFHELKFTNKPEILIFNDSLTYIHRSLSKARFSAFSSGRLFISPWALSEAKQGRISIQIYVKHELSHVLILQNKGIFSELTFPKWLLEGIAVYSANQMGTSFYPGKEETYQMIVQDNFMPPFDFKTKRENKIKLNVKYPITFMYSEFACIVDYLIIKYGKNKFLSYMKALIKENDHDEIFKRIYGVDFDESMSEFLKYAATATEQTESLKPCL